MKLNIVPAGGFARELMSMAAACDFEIEGLYDDKPSQGLKPVDQIPINSSICIAIGSSKQRKNFYTRLNSKGNFPAIIHPRALIQEPTTVNYGEGTVITAGSILTCDISLGRFVLVNLNCSIGHDCKLHDFVSLMPGVNLGGAVELEEGVYVGTGATILPEIKIGAWSTVGAGALVTKDVPPGKTVKGIPAR
jgi:sugar O-acyltransferase (sialic acid O-acetyltransferase NeuD family)